ncbi:DUF4350 domain-containing protein [Streptomyces triticirhizae]|uniref:DUF4350 domain-containing protein n=1 Tax=Streptomyces triticirhizae TaxID=2483353 RepID=A0A3M2L6K3_9ACTN|nr:DUF4350 domain-containing protein [Streptomyces triticirhizae]RMI31545.1 DUF4350 domain-containing protein [Streptomyces triticirhizae]
MTAPEATNATGTAVSPDARHLLRRARPLAIGAVALVLAGLLLAVLNSGDSGTLDPRSTVPGGSRAVAELLADHGVTTTLAGTAAEAAQATAATGPDTTLLVARPEALTPTARATLRDAAQRAGARTVLLAPGPEATAAFAPSATVAPPVEADERAPSCDWPTAQRAGSARLGGYRYALPDGTTDAVSCYPAEGTATLVTLPADTPEGTGETVLLGSPDLLTNDHLDEAGNASLALQLLGAHPNLVWYLPTGAEAPADADRRTVSELLPDGWRWAALQLAVAAALAALWRARRLGPVLTEPLPVTVPAAETTEGRARLYHQTHATAQAADALRTATRTRLAPAVGIPPADTHSPEALPPAVAAHAGTSPTAVHALLFGPAPEDDRALVRLADELDALERRVTDHPPTTEPPTGEELST